MKKGYRELSHKELLSIQIGLDTGEKEFIEEGDDGLEWFPVFIRDRKEGGVKAQFPTDVDTDIDHPFRIKCEEEDK